MAYHPLKEVFLYIGISGFLSVFQAAGCGLGLAAWFHFSDEFKKRKPRRSDLPSLFFGVPFISLFALAPLFMAYEFGGWLGALFQFAVLVMIVAFTCKSWKSGDRPEPLDRKALEEKERSQPVVPDMKKNFLRALPGSLLCFYLSAAYLAAWLGKPFPAMETDWLGALVKIEFLVIHSLPFISLITLIRFQHKQWRFFQWFLFVTWYSLYLGFAMEIRDHWDAIPAFAAATLGTYLGFMLQESKANRVVLVFKRWGICLALLVFVSAVVGARDWSNTEGLIKVGMAYFLLIGAVELTPVYRIHWCRWIHEKIDRYGRRKTAKQESA